MSLVGEGVVGVNKPGIQALYGFEIGIGIL